jgi:hypothetical protein
MLLPCTDDVLLCGVPSLHVSMENCQLWRGDPLLPFPQAIPNKCGTSSTMPMPANRCKATINSFSLQNTPPAESQTERHPLPPMSPPPAQLLPTATLSKKQEKEDVSWCSSERMSQTLISPCLFHLGAAVDTLTTFAIPYTLTTVTPTQPPPPSPPSLLQPPSPPEITSTLSTHPATTTWSLGTQ